MSAFSMREGEDWVFLVFVEILMLLLWGDFDSYSSVFMPWMESKYSKSEEDWAEFSIYGYLSVIFKSLPKPALTWKESFLIA